MIKFENYINEEFENLSPDELGDRLWTAIELNRDAQAMILIDNGANLNFIHVGSFPLVKCIIQNKIDLFKYLVEHGADIEQKTGGGYTSLLVVCYCIPKRPKNFEILVEYLIEKGADINAKNNNGENFIACSKGKFQDHTKEYLINKFGLFKMLGMGLELSDELKLKYKDDIAVKVKNILF